MMNRLTIIAMACILVVGCTKTIRDDGSDIINSGYTLLRASIEDLKLPGYDPSAVLWEKGDKIGLFSSDSRGLKCWNVRTSSDGRREAEFYGPVVNGSAIMGVFPYEQNLEGSHESVVCNLSGVQKFATGDDRTRNFLEYNPYVYGMADNGYMVFKYPFGILNISFDLAYDINISDLKILSDTGISGRMLYDGKSLSPTEASTKTIAIDFGGEYYSSVKINGKGGIDVILPPAEYNGLVVEIGVEGGETFIFNTPEIEVPRISNGNFTAGHIKFSLTDLGSLEQVDGFLEEEQL